MSRLQPSPTVQPLPTRSYLQLPAPQQHQPLPVDHSSKQPSPWQSQIYSFGLDQRSQARQRVETKLQLHRESKESQPVRFQHAEKLKHFEELKASNIDDLNTKIKKLISKLTIEDSQTSITREIPTRKTHQRLKTEYALPSFTHEVSKDMIESEVFQEDKVEIYKKKHNYTNEVQQIRKKYKDATSQSRELKNDRSVGSLSNNSKVEESFRHGGLNADLIRFRQKIKQNHEIYKHELNAPCNPSPIKQDIRKQQSTTPNENNPPPKRNLDAEMEKYNQRLEKYNSQKELALPNKPQYAKVPLRQATNTYQDQQKKTESKTAIKREEPHKIKLVLRSQQQKPVEESQQPLTADFRYCEDEPNQLQLLLKSIMAQVKLDEKFRNGKKWFQRQTSPHKWHHLMDHLDIKSVDLDESSTHQIFSLCEDEENPFYTTRESDFTIASLVDIFLQCESHWFQHMIKKFQREKLQAEGFVARRVDYGQKGYLQIGDLVRFVNWELDTQIRNRDMFLIYERLKSEDRLTYCDLLEVICTNDY